MSSALTFYIHSTQTAPLIETALRQNLRARQADPALYRIHVHPADAEDREGGRTDFGLEPTVIASIQPPRGDGDGKLIAAALATAHATASDLIALHDYTPLFSYRDGVAYLSVKDRKFYEEDVLPGFEGAVAWIES